MNKKLALILALILTLFLMGSVSAGFFDFLNFGGDSHSNNTVPLMRLLHILRNFISCQAITLQKARHGI